MTVAIDPSVTLADLVTRHPGLARELERRSLDYCCGGQHTLADACADQGLDVDRTVAELAALPAGDVEPWSTYGPTELVDHLEATHHVYLHDELPRLTALADKVAQVHGDRHPELLEVRRLTGALRDDLDPHLAEEEQVLFPMIRELAATDAGASSAPAFPGGTVGRPIAVMLREHDQVGELLARLRIVAAGYALPIDACASYAALFEGLEQLETDTHLHVHKENNLLFPAVVALEAGRSA